MKTPEPARLRLIASCPERIGIVARVATFLADRGASIMEANQYSDPHSQTFFMRSEFIIDDELSIRSRLEDEFGPIAKELKMEWRLSDANYRQRVVMLVSKFDHCLAYLLHRRKVGDMNFDVPCVISNHEDLRSLVEWYGIPYHHVPVPTDPAGKQAALEKTAQLIAEAQPDSIVLARYMQIFPPWLCELYRHRVINIHHSFLPSFVGGKPYHQAEERGVKLIGATCHYVTEELDAGPIIEQDVARIRHSDTIKDMMRLGKDVENAVLSRGLRYHLEDRVLVHGNKTILFSS
jgi:formyltetrahydrofolate deformylase|uniref:formyltetrahydrofolate deformylase n=1 Tax=Cephaloticoccus sp. TaxID=1985742 RepID=UPI004049AE3B